MGTRRNHFWGTGAIENISERLQQELPGLRGLSSANIKRMRQFYEGWHEYLLAENQGHTIRPTLSNEIQIDLLVLNRQLQCMVAFEFETGRV